MTKPLIAVGIKSPDKEKVTQIELNPDSPMQESRKFINSFKEPANHLQAFLVSTETREELEVFETESRTGKNRVFHCRLGRGLTSVLGLRVKLTVSEIYQEDTKLYCYGVTAIAENIQDPIKPEIQNLFTFNNTISKKEKKDLKQSKAKKRKSVK